MPIISEVGFFTLRRGLDQVAVSFLKHPQLCSWRGCADSSPHFEKGVGAGCPGPRGLRAFLCAGAVPSWGQALWPGRGCGQESGPEDTAREALCLGSAPPEAVLKPFSRLSGLDPPWGISFCNSSHVSEPGSPGGAEWVGCTTWKELEGPRSRVQHQGVLFAAPVQSPPGEPPPLRPAPASRSPSPLLLAGTDCYPDHDARFLCVQGPSPSREG